MTVISLPNPEATSAWQFWQVTTSWGFYLFAQQEGKCLHLGAFTSLGNLKVQQLRFLENENTTVVMEVSCDALASFLAEPETQAAPRFVGVLGTAWSGYSLKEINEAEVELVYAADLRHEWLGVYSEAEAFEAIEQHYDRRRNQCLIC